jgi:uncharacterized protein (UPF0305 family)
MIDAKLSQYVNTICDMAVTIRNSQSCPKFVITFVYAIERLVMKIETRQAEILGKAFKMTRYVSPDYNRNYFAANKATIAAKRSLRRASMTEAERETKRQKACERAARSRDKQRELKQSLEKLAVTLESLTICSN